MAEYKVIEIGEVREAHIGIRVHIDEKERCLEECRKRGISLSRFIRECISCYFEYKEEE